MKITKIILFFSLIVTLSSCSYLQNRDTETAKMYLQKVVHTSSEYRTNAVDLLSKID